MKNRLMTPGPASVPPSSLLAMAQPMVHHRSDSFQEIMRRLPDELRYVFKTKSDIILFSSSSTGAMESAVVNLLSPDDYALVIGGGKFGERWANLCKTYGVKYDFIDVEYGMSVDIEEVAKKLRSERGYRCIYATLCETSTGVVHDIKSLGKLKSELAPESLLVVDAVSGLGSDDLQPDNWGVDVVVAGSQKGLMTPPGLAFISLNEPAWKAVESSKLPKFYFDLLKARKALEANQTPFTCSISLIFALMESLSAIRAEGIDNFIARHALLAEATRQGVKAIGLELFAKSPSNAVTAVKIPEGINGKELLKYIEKRYGMVFAGGQDSLSGKILRVAHLGYVDDLDIISSISAIEMALQSFGYEVELGSGVQAAERVLTKVYKDSM